MGRKRTTVEILSPTENSKLVWEELVAWVNGQDKLPQYIKDIFVERSANLRLRLQAMFLEIQRRYMNQIAADIMFEENIKHDIRQNWPFMTAKEKLEALKTITSMNENRLDRLEQQMAGFDFFNTVELSISSLNESKVSKALSNQVKQIPSEQRQLLLNQLSTIIEDIEKEEKEEFLLTSSSDDDAQEKEHE